MQFSLYFDYKTIRTGVPWYLLEPILHIKSRRRDAFGFIFVHTFDASMKMK